MKLLTHNLLTSKILKNVVNGYPLKIEATKVEVKSVDFQPEFVARMMKKVEYKALYEAAQTVSKFFFCFISLRNSVFFLFRCLNSKLDYSKDLPTIENYNQDELESNEELLKKIHMVLLEVEVLEGNLICPETGRKFPIMNGIPNMLVNEDEL
jgi:multifunctional methyltransferase subunit TRM112